MAEVRVVGVCKDGLSVGRFVSDGTTDFTESWRGPDRGWVRGGMSVGSFLKYPPASEASLKALGIPLEGTRAGDVDLGSS